VADAFRSWRLPAGDAAYATYAELLASARFEQVGKGRRGTVLVAVDEQGGIPIVRTTTSYDAPAQRFGAIHGRLADEIRRVASLSHRFNNALIEHYTRAYSTMKPHSDQALDLAEESTIALYSCYRDPERPTRRLRVRPKESGAAFELPLAHGSVVTFSLDTNRRFVHAIELTSKSSDDGSDNEWIGITFRTSKTFVRFIDGEPRLGGGEPLTLATDDERRAFFQLRSRENAEPSFVYLALSYTISESDLRPPE
jgi:hypothetical protein